MEHEPHPRILQHHAELLLHHKIGPSYSKRVSVQNRMSESKAAEDYKIFESLRNRFSDVTVSCSSSPPSRPEPRKSSKRRFDPRSNAPPLKPLIEEGDQLQEALVSD